MTRSQLLQVVASIFPIQQHDFVQSQLREQNSNTVLMSEHRSMDKNIDTVLTSEHRSMDKNIDTVLTSEHRSMDKNIDTVLKSEHRSMDKNSVLTSEHCSMDKKKDNDVNLRSKHIQIDKNTVGADANIWKYVKPCTRLLFAIFGPIIIILAFASILRRFSYTHVANSLSLAQFEPESLTISLSTPQFEPESLFKFGIKTEYKKKREQTCPYEYGSVSYSPFITLGFHRAQIYPSILHLKLQSFRGYMLKHNFRRLDSDHILNTYDTFIDLHY